MRDIMEIYVEQLNSTAEQVEVEITVNYSESNLIEAPTTFTSVEEFNSLIRTAAMSENGLGYSKTSTDIKWVANGETYEYSLRIDITPDHQLFNLADRIKSGLEWFVQNSVGQTSQDAKRMQEATKFLA